MAFVIWREWYNEFAVKKLTEMGTLPRNETEIDDFDMDDGATVARIIAQKANEQESESFREGGDLVIVEPAAIAGTYTAEVGYDPVFTAFKNDDE